MAPLTVVRRVTAWIGGLLQAVGKRLAGSLSALRAVGAEKDDQHTLRACPSCAALLPRRESVCPYCRRNLPALAARIK